MKSGGQNIFASVLGSLGQQRKPYSLSYTLGLLLSILIVSLIVDLIIWTPYITLTQPNNQWISITDGAGEQLTIKVEDAIELANPSNLYKDQWVLLMIMFLGLQYVTPLVFLVGAAIWTSSDIRSPKYMELLSSTGVTRSMVAKAHILATFRRFSTPLIISMGMAPLFMGAAIYFLNVFPVVYHSNTVLIPIVVLTREVLALVLVILSTWAVSVLALVLGTVVAITFRQLIASILSLLFLVPLMLFALFGGIALVFATVDPLVTKYHQVPIISTVPAIYALVLVSIAAGLVYSARFLIMHNVG